MLANPLTKGLRDRWMGMLVAALSIGAMTWLAGLIYRDLDDEITAYVDQMPDVVSSMLGLVGDAGAYALVLSEMVGFIAPLTLAGLAISIGSGTIAGEEKRGTFELLLSHPSSRTKVLLQKLAAALLLTVFGGVAIHLSLAGVGAVLGVDAPGLDVGAASLHATVLALFFGTTALAIGAWTGNAGAASGSAGGLLVISWLWATLLPLVDRIADLARLSPWYYFSSTSPLLNGVDWGHMAVLGALTVTGAGLAVVGLRRRDLKSGWTSSGLRDRLATNERVDAVLRRLSGNGHPVGSITTKTLGDIRLAATVTGLILAVMALMMGMIYRALDDALVQLGGALPETMLEVLGIADFTTVHGFLNAELFSITGPAAIIYLAIVMGGKALAGEQDDGSLDLLLANPVSRTRVLLAKASALAVTVVGVSLVFGAFTWLGVAAAGIEVRVGGIVAVSVHLAGLGLFFGGVALLLGAAFGRGRITMAGTAGIALLTYVANGFLAVNDRFAGWLRASPWYYYTGSNPLQEGLEPGHLGVLLGAALLLLAAAAHTFERADVKQ